MIGKNMHRYIILMLAYFVSFDFLIARDIDSLLMRIYDRAQQQEIAREQMCDYSYHQSVHFIKRDGDGDIEEQSLREFKVYVRPPDFNKRLLISAQNYKHGNWSDVTAAECNKERKTESQQFSLTEMVAPENRSMYSFAVSDTGTEKQDSLICLTVRAIKKDDKHFDGRLWFRAEDYTLIRAELKPSDTSVGIKSMCMKFDMASVENYWLPARVFLEAHLSFLFFFKGSIQTTIDFSDYQLNQDLPDSLLFEDPEN